MTAVLKKSRTLRERPYCLKRLLRMYRSRICSVVTVTRLWVERKRNLSLMPEKGKNIFSSPKTWDPIWTHTHLRIQRVVEVHLPGIKLTECEFDNYWSCSDKIKHRWTSMYTVPFAYILCTETHVSNTIRRRRHIEIYFKETQRECVY